MAGETKLVKSEERLAQRQAIIDDYRMRIQKATILGKKEEAESINFCLNCFIKADSLLDEMFNELYEGMRKLCSN